jgi:hypothetical protein
LTFLKFLLRGGPDELMKVIEELKTLANGDVEKGIDTVTKQGVKRASETPIASLPDQPSPKSRKVLFRNHFIFLILFRLLSGAC